MAEFRKLIITTAGFDFLTQAVKDNTAIAFSRVVLAARNYTDEEIATLATLADTMQTIKNLGIVKPSPETIQITAVVSNRAVETGYSYSSIGLFAKNANDEEVLFAVSGSNSPGDIPPNTSLFSARLELFLTVSNAEQITFTVDDNVICGTHGIYIGSGDMPDGYDVQIDPTGEAETVKDRIRTEGHAILDMVYPVGSIYMSVNAADPTALFGGTWERLKDCFLLGAGDSYAAGATGGEAKHTLTVNEMPSHTHTEMLRVHGYSDWGNYTTKGYGVSFKVMSSDNAEVSYCQAGTTIADSEVVSAYTDTLSAGGGAAHNNMPPYLTVYMWKRTA